MPAKTSARFTALAAGLALTCALVSSVAPPKAYAQGGQASVSLIRDTEIEEIIRVQATPMWRAAGLTPQNVDLILVGDKELNAFVSGGQNIFLNTGLIMKTENPNQLNGVIAHETGHIALAHLARANDGMRSAVATQMITMALGLVAAMAAPDPSAGIGLLYSADYFATLQLFTYTRSQEANADQAAAEYLERAGMSGKGLVDFFKVFRYQEVFSEARRAPYFRSHPLSNERISSLERRVAAAPHFSTPDSPEALMSHTIMVAKLKGFINYPQQTYQDYPDTDTSYPARYARAIAYYKDLNIEKSLSAIEDLLKEQPNNPYLYELKGQILFETGRIAEAEAPQRRMVELKPDAPLLRVALAQTLVATDIKEKAAEAIPLIQRAMVQDDDNPMGWRILADAYTLNDQPGMARLATAEQNFTLGQMDRAREFSMRSLELLDEGTPEYRRARDIINAAENTVMSRRRGS